MRQAQVTHLTKTLTSKHDQVRTRDIHRDVCEVKKKGKEEKGFGKRGECGEVNDYNAIGERCVGLGDFVIFMVNSRIF